MKSTAKDYFFKAALCFLANKDVVGCKSAMEKYQFEDPSFESSRQNKFLNSIVAACEARDGKMFAKNV